MQKKPAKAASDAESQEKEECDGYTSQDEEKHVIITEDTAVQCSSSSSMKTHLASVYECAECVKKFKSKKTLKEHWHKIHADETNVQRKIRIRHKSPKRNCGSKKVLLKCCDCDKTYMSAAGLSRHRAAIHLQKFPHVCINCGQGFVQKTSLQRHQRIHTKERPFQCGYCIAAFKDKWHLTQHERIHNGSKPYPCNCCDETFTLKITSREHIRKTHEASKRKCPECSHTCQTFGALASHWKLKHASQWAHKNSCKSHSSVHGNEESPSLSIEWRNKHAIKWSNPKTRKKRERINIPMLEVMANINTPLLEAMGNTSLFTESDDDDVKNYSENLSICSDKGASQTGSLSGGIHGNNLPPHLSSDNNSNKEATEALVPSVDTIKEEEGE